MLKLQFLRILSLLTIFLFSIGYAHAHPHIWIDARLIFLFNDDAQVKGVRHVWQFDELFSTFTLQGIKREKDGEIPSAELKKITDQWLLNMSGPESHFFTSISFNGKPVDLLPPTDAKTIMDTQTNQLILSFDLLLQKPLKLTNQVLEVDVIDPGYFVAFNYKGSQVAELKNGSHTCRQSHVPPRMLDLKSQRQLGAIGPDQKDLPENLRQLVRQLSHQFKLAC